MPRPRRSTDADDGVTGGPGEQDLAGRPSEHDRLPRHWARTWPDLDTRGLPLMARIMELARHSQAFHELCLRPLHLGHPEYAALSILRMQEPPHELTPTDLSRTLNQTTAGTSKTIDRLVGMGLVERVPHPRDNRRTLVRLTPEGITKAEQSCLAESALRHELLALVGDEAEALRVLDVLNQAFETVNRG